MVLTDCFNVQNSELESLHADQEGNSQSGGAKRVHTRVIVFGAFGVHSKRSPRFLFGSKDINL